MSREKKGKTNNWKKGHSKKTNQDRHLVICYTLKLFYYLIKKNVHMYIFKSQKTNKKENIHSRIL